MTSHVKEYITKLGYIEKYVQWGSFISSFREPPKFVPDEHLVETSN